MLQGRVLGCVGVRVRSARQGSRISPYTVGRWMEILRKSSCEVADGNHEAALKSLEAPSCEGVSSTATKPLAERRRC